MEKLCKRIGASLHLRPCKGKTPFQSYAPIAKKPPIKQSLCFEIGWKHWVEGLFTQKKVERGGNRTLDVPRHASLYDCLKLAKGFFFQKGKSPERDDSVH